MTCADIEFVAQQMYHLKKLRVAGCERLSSPESYGAVSRISAIEELDLSGCEQLNCDVLRG